MYYYNGNGHEWLYTYQIAYLLQCFGGVDQADFVHLAMGVPPDNTIVPLEPSLAIVSMVSLVRTPSLLFLEAPSLLATIIAADFDIFNYLNERSPLNNSKI